LQHTPLSHPPTLPPPTPPLFPYTTLFRSRRATSSIKPKPTFRCVEQRAATRPAFSGARQRHVERVRERLALGEFAHHPFLLRREDRKSTRLNSSHVKISYAVFCLKKKRSK